MFCNVLLILHMNIFKIKLRWNFNMENGFENNSVIPKGPIHYTKADTIYFLI